ncbi:MAG: DUF433 domain-containing protein [Halieaceae bacterium]|nr:DUF433 domain-containing protein [Halieaceae bacterium]
MELTTFFDFIDEDTIRIKGHRVGIEHVLYYYLEGYDPDEIAQEFPGLSLDKIYATITFYLTNREAIDTYLQRRQLRDEQAYQQWAAQPSPLIQRLHAFCEKQTEYK